MEKLLKKLPFYDAAWFNFIRFLTRHFFEDDCQQKAASLTYTTMLSLVPILTVMLMILSTVPALESVREQISQLIYSNLLPQSGLQVSQYLEEFAEKSSNLTAIGAVILFVTTIMTLTTIERAFNKIWRVESRSGGFKSILRYWTIITVGPLLLGVVFVMWGTIQSLSFLNQEVAGYGIDWTFWLGLLTFAITLAGFIGMYWFIPKARVPVKSAAIAGVIVAVLFYLLKTVFGTIMANFTSYEAIYGAFAALPIFLLWIYLSWNVILLGVEISYTLTIFATEEVYPRHPLLSLIDMLNLVYDRYQQGDTVTEQELRNVLGRKELPKWYTYLNYLKDSDLIALTDKDEYVLKKDLTGMTLWDFYRTLPYPLPIKDELNQMNPQAQQHWLSLLVKRFIKIENYSKSELDLSIAQIFAHSHPRPKVETSEPMVNSDSSHEKKFDADAYDPKASVVKDDDVQNEDAIIPKGSEGSNANNSFNNSFNKSTNAVGERTTANPYGSSRSDIVSNTNSTWDSTSSTPSSATSTPVSTSSSTSEPSKGGFLRGLGHKDKPIITEDDNPFKS